MHILFVCTGNTCRSPMAAALARHHAALQGVDVTVDSAGIYAFSGHPMARYATDALIRRQVVVPNHQSQPVTKELVTKADFIFTMTASHKDDLLYQYPEASGKTHTLLEFVGSDPSSTDVADPFGGPVEVYEACAGELDGVIEQLMKKLSDKPSA
ncbi:low molecular weight protein arginine phosphatase [Alicyclobacillus fastidiosus]|uniref:Low molecular weight protein arginine phosphatase n=1 Tax=Alicyclobacillus fastidiosus TaxID=392011 RepID=A0ABY6ZIA9_9BACL|nr:low molecular weight protein arginine phosphatase [Alicyclobacillus fastidiosus]WAH41849.1 low molecular weight protein arginine phosphatase [Alicyclobacillus fastidiosus]GMA63553.1 protein-arginine-phosphatase [Alicyclobacillus fastidiosus]